MRVTMSRSPGWGAGPPAEHGDGGGADRTFTIAERRSRAHYGAGRTRARVSLSRVFTGLAPVVLLASMAAPERALAAPPSSTSADEDGSSGDANPVERDDAARTSDGTGDAPRPGRASDGPRRVNLDDEFLVEGKLEKPNAFYILRRSTLGYDWARLDARFSPLVLESVQDPLF